MSWTHIEDTTPKARHKYICLLCSRFIDKGEKHIKRFGFTEEGKESIRMHFDCEKLTWDWDEADWECGEPEEFRRELGVEI